MHPAVERIVEFVGMPLRKPSCIPWKRSLEEVGFEFPRDYKEIVDAYGSVLINGELTVWTPTVAPVEPGGPGSFPGFVYRTTRGIGEYFGSVRERHPEECPFPIYPEDGGLLAWANNFNADHCFWLATDDSPDNWRVVIWYRQLGMWDRFDGGTAEFLLAVLRGEYRMADEIAPALPEVPKWQQRGERTA